MAAPAEWTAENGNGAYLLTVRNCPFRELPDEYTEMVCGLHQSVAEGMLGELASDDFTWEHLSSMREGAPCCTTSISSGGA